MSPSNTFCALPFCHTMINSPGTILTCGVSQPTEHTVITHSVSDMWNSQHQRQLRLDFIEGKKPAACSRCWALENEDNTKGSSVRLNPVNSIDYKDIKDRVEYAAANDGYLDVDPFDIQISAGNLCNLACKMCGPWNSTTYSKFFEERGYTKDTIKFSATSQGGYFLEDLGVTYDWPVTHPLTEIMQDTAGSIRTLYITGGEPTVIKQNIEFLEYLVAQKHSGQIRITINTNATNINKELLAVLNNFLSVGFVISVDGIDDIAYIQRTPSRWNQIEKNIDAIVEWFGQRYNPRDWICFNSVVTCLNFHHMPAMWSYLLDRYSRSRAPIGFGFIPIIPADVNFGVEAVPAPARDQISQEFDNFKAKAQTHKANTTNVIESFEYWLNNINYAADYAPIQFTLDKVQGLHPELNVAEIYRIFYPDVL